MIRSTRYSGVLIIAVIAIALSACAAVSTKTYAPDGGEAYSLKCGGLVRSWSSCLEKAGEICGSRGYEVILSAGDQSSGLVASPSLAVAGGRIERGMLVRCKE